MGYVDGQTMIEFKDKILQKINTSAKYMAHFPSVEGTAAKTTSPYFCARWDATDDNFEELFDGMVMIIRIPVAGNGSYGTGLSINGGDYHPVVYNVNSMISTRYGVNGSITLVYNATQTGTLYLGSGSQTITGCWQMEDYNADTTISYGTLAYYLRPYAANDPIYKYKFVVMDKDNRLTPIIPEEIPIVKYASSTTYAVGDIIYYTPSGGIRTTYKCIQAGKGKTPSSQPAYWQVYDLTPTNKPFRPDKIYLYNTTAVIPANSAIGANTLTFAGYNATNVAICNFPLMINAYRMIYLCGKYDPSTGLFTLRGAGTANHDYYTLVPNDTANLNLSSYFEDGWDYILLGASYSSNEYVHLRDDHPMFHFDGTNLLPYHTWENKLYKHTIVIESEFGGDDYISYTVYSKSSEPIDTRAKLVAFFGEREAITDIGYFYGYDASVFGEPSSEGIVTYAVINIGGTEISFNYLDVIHPRADGVTFQLNSDNQISDQVKIIL